MKTNYQIFLYFVIFIILLILFYISYKILIKKNELKENFSGGKIPKDTRFGDINDNKKSIREGTRIYYSRGF